MAEGKSDVVANPMAGEVPIVAAGGAPQPVTMMTTTTITTTTSGNKEQAAKFAEPHPDLCCCQWFLNQCNCSAGCYNSLCKPAMMLSYCDCEDGNRDCYRQEGSCLFLYCCNVDAIQACGPGVQFKPFADAERITVDMPSPEQRKFDTTCCCLCWSCSVATGGKPLECAQYGDQLFCTTGQAYNCLALRPILYKGTNAGSCLEFNVLGARKESEQIPMCNICSNQADCVCCFLCEQSNMANCKLPSRLPYCGHKCPICCLCWDCRAGCPWFGDGLGDLIGHRDYVPCKVSCCGITLWQIGAYKEYLAVGTQAAATVMQTQVVTQVTTTGAAAQEIARD